jgi:Ca-activated chloride channel family protein
MNPRDLLAWPEALPILLAVPALWLLLRGLDSARARRLSRLIGPRAGVLADDLSAGERRARRRLLVVGSLLALIALLQPIYGEGLRMVSQRGVDLLVCLDVSQSMLARDVHPNRLQRARQEVRALADQARGDRMGLIAFSGEARLTVPLTQDMDSFAELVDLTDTLSIRTGGTDLGGALETALRALPGRTGHHEAVLLLTDGEDLEERGLRVAEACRERNITVHCVGFGTELGSKITVEGEDGEMFLRDKNGEEVVSALRSDSLRRIAETTGGIYMDADSRPLPLLDLYRKQIVPMAKKAFETEGRHARRNRFQWPLLAAFFLFIMEFCMTDRKRT